MNKIRTNQFRGGVFVSFQVQQLKIIDFLLCLTQQRHGTWQWECIFLPVECALLTSLMGFC